MNGPRGMEQLCVNIGKLSEEEVITKLEANGDTLKTEVDNLKIKNEELSSKDSTNQKIIVSGRMYSPTKRHINGKFTEKLLILCFVKCVSGAKQII